MLVQEPGHLARHLQRGHVRVQVQPINTLDLQRDMSFEHVVDVHYRSCHSPTAWIAQGRLRRPAPSLLRRRPRRGRPGGGPAPLPLKVSHAATASTRCAARVPWPQPSSTWFEHASLKHWISPEGVAAIRTADETCLYQAKRVEVRGIEPLASTVRLKIGRMTTNVDGRNACSRWVRER